MPCNTASLGIALVVRYFISNGTTTILTPDCLREITKEIKPYDLHENMYRYISKHFFQFQTL